MNAKSNQKTQQRLNQRWIAAANTQTDDHTTKITMSTMCVAMALSQMTTNV